MPNSVTYGADIANRTELVDALDSQRVFFGDDWWTELAPSEAPFMTMLRAFAKRKARGTEEAYVEDRASYLSKPSYYVSASAVTAISSSVPNTSITGFKLVSAIDGNTRVNSVKEGDILVLVDYTDPTLHCPCVVVARADDGDDYQYSLKTLANACGFPITINPGVRTKAILASNAYGENSDASAPGYESPKTRWNTIQSFKESFEISDELAATDQIVYGKEMIKQMIKTQRRWQAMVDAALLYASHRIGVTVGDPFSAIPENYPEDADGNSIRTTLSLMQAIQYTGSANVLGDSRIFKLARGTATLKDIDAVFARVSEYGGDKIAMLGSGAMTALNEIFLRTGKYNITASDQKFGLKWKTLETQHLDLEMTPHKGLTLSNSYLTNCMFIVDKENVQMRELIPMYTEKLVTNKTGKWYEVRGNVGLRVKYPETHAMIWFV
jgi:hypothetical protein